jgi:hypothetical protein
MTSLRRVEQLCLALSLFAPTSAAAQGQPLARHFVAGTEERYQVSLEIKTEIHSVLTETRGGTTYVTPRVASADLQLRWHAARRILSVETDGLAQIEEQLAPVSGACADSIVDNTNADPAFKKSLIDFCLAWWKESMARYSESPRGNQKESTAQTTVTLGESAPPLLAMWLRRAARTSVILPETPFEVGASKQNALQPSSQFMPDANGSETTEWLEAPGETPAATLHVLQQLSWKSAADPAAASQPNIALLPLRTETFFADSLTTLSLVDASIIRAMRTASRTTVHPVDPVPGLPNPPDFSNKLTLTVTIERLP